MFRDTAAIFAVATFARPCIALVKALSLSLSKDVTLNLESPLLRGEEE